MIQSIRKTASHYEHFELDFQLQLFFSLLYYYAIFIPFDATIIVKHKRIRLGKSLYILSFENNTMLDNACHH